MSDYPTDKDAMREFYPGTGVWKQEYFIYFCEESYICRAREVKGGLLVFVPGITLEDLKK